jgi:MGT family glycosyltransferase
MARYVFLCETTHGHINPTLPVAQELVARGEEVIYYLPESFQETIVKTGASFRGFQLPKIPPKQERSFMAFLEKILAHTFHLLPQIEAWLEIDQPDCIVYENICLWARAAVSKLHIPVVCFFTSPLPTLGATGAKKGAAKVVDLQEKEVRQGLRRLCHAYALPAIEPETVALHTERLNLAFFPRAFQPGGGTFDKTFDERFVFVGPSIVPRQDSADFPRHRLDPDRMIYISMGTIFNYQADFFNLCFAALKDLPWQIVLSYGKRLDVSALDPVPANFLIAPYVPQLEVLASAQLFVTHGGMNSVMESCYYGVPMVIVPQIPEQARTARQAQELGLGVTLAPTERDCKTFRETVLHVVQDRSYHERLREMQQIVQNTGGYKRAADILIHEFARV